MIIPALLWGFSPLKMIMAGIKIEVPEAPMETTTLADILANDGPLHFYTNINYYDQMYTIDTLTDILNKKNLYVLIKN